MKKIIVILVACIFGLVCCDKIDHVLDTTNYKKPDTSSFPLNEKDAAPAKDASAPGT